MFALLLKDRLQLLRQFVVIGAVLLHDPLRLHGCRVSPQPVLLAYTSMNLSFGPGRDIPLPTILSLVSHSEPRQVHSHPPVHVVNKSLMPSMAVHRLFRGLMDPAMQVHGKRSFVVLPSVKAT
jgi:hypothetical protein